jgi:hypothetical protein
MSRILAVLAVMAFTVAGPGLARSSEEWSFEAFQPIWTDNDLYLSRVTVLTFNSGEVGIVAVLATCDSNQVMSDYGPQQRNAAFDLGLRAEVTFNSDREPPLFGDTLRVILRETKPAVDLYDHDYATVLAATVQCVLLNAAQSPSIKFVALRVDGGQTHRRYGGVYSTAPFRKGPKQRGWSEQ